MAEKKETVLAAGRGPRAARGREATMKEHHVRRLPVEGFGGTVAGIISMNDIVLAAGKKGIGGADVVDTFQAICAHHHPIPHVTAA